MSARKSKKSLRKPAAKPAGKRLARSAPSSRAGRSAKKPKANRPAKKAAGRPATSAKAKRPLSRPAKKPAAKKVATAAKAKLEKQKRLEKERALKAKQKQQLEKERERERAQKEREKQRLEKERQRERENAAKAKQKQQLEKERERERAQKEREKQRLEKERERERARLDKEKAKAQQEKERQKALAQKAREAEREAKKKAVAEEKQRKIQERDALREQIRRQKEEERARRDAEREAYRKAKETERERLRAEREAARRALEGKVARASKRLARQEGLLGRGTTTTRVYRPDAIPDQSGTTRRGMEAPFRPLGVRPIPTSMSLGDDSINSQPVSAELPTASDAARPTPPPPAVLSVEERYQLILERLGRADVAFQREYRENFDMSWIYHDSALEGVVYTFQELKAAVDPSVAVVPDSSLQPACEEIRRHRLAIELVRDLAERKRVPINVDMVKKLYVTLHPEEGDVKTVKYRKDIPQHRLYFHEYVPPDKIAYRVRQIVDWLNGPEPKKMKNPLRVAARIHYDLVRVFPFQTDSGKVSRLLMNLILMRSGYPPAIIHSTERQRYYEALKGQLPIILQMMADAISNALLSIEKLLDDYESRPRSGTATTSNAS